MQEEIVHADYMSSAEKIYAEIPHLGDRDEEQGYGAPRTDPLSRIIEIAGYKLTQEVRDGLHSQHRIMELEEGLEGLQRKLLNLELAVLRAGEGAARVSRERARQQVEENWSGQHDSQWDEGQLLKAAQCYVRVAFPDPPGPPAPPPKKGPPPSQWPWGDHWWKPSHDKIRNLEKAGALIAAEIDRLKGLDE